MKISETFRLPFPAKGVMPLHERSAAVFLLKEGVRALYHGFPFFFLLLRWGSFPLLFCLPEWPYSLIVPFSLFFFAAPDKSASSTPLLDPHSPLRMLN